jgi:hypothetical protein
LVQQAHLLINSFRSETLAKPVHWISRRICTWVSQNHQPPISRVAGWRQAMGYEVPSWRCILPLGNSQSILLGFPRMVWAIDCEVPGLDFRDVVCVDMIAPQAETNASAGGKVGTAAFTVGS